MIWGQIYEHTHIHPKQAGLGIWDQDFRDGNPFVWSLVIDKAFVFKVNLRLFLLTQVSCTATACLQEHVSFVLFPIYTVEVACAQRESRSELHSGYWVNEGWAIGVFLSTLAYLRILDMWELKHREIYTGALESRHHRITLPDGGVGGSMEWICSWICYTQEFKCLPI